MIFCWWSHWLWIGLLSSSFMLLFVVAFTFPNQKEFVSDYNQNLKLYNTHKLNKLYNNAIDDTDSTLEDNYSYKILNVANRSAVLFDKEVLKNKNGKSHNKKESCKEKDNINKRIPRIKSRLLSAYFIKEKNFKRSVAVRDSNNNKRNHINIISGNNATLGEKFNYTNLRINFMDIRNISALLMIDVKKVNNTKGKYSEKLELRNALPIMYSTTENSINSTIIDIKHRMPFVVENIKTGYDIQRSHMKNMLTRSASTTPNDYNDGNVSSEAIAIKRTHFMDVGGISAICFIVFGLCCTVSTLSVVMYRRRYINKPHTLSEPDSSVYIDDSTLRDNSDEMYSLDNDSFLNSLEAMTIQNYWVDTVKHTKL